MSGIEKCYRLRTVYSPIRMTEIHLALSSCKGDSEWADLGHGGQIADRAQHLLSSGVSRNGS